MDERLVKLLFGIGAAITVGWFTVIVIFPFVRVDYRTPPEANLTMTVFITALAGLLGGAYLKTRNPVNKDDEPKTPDEETNDGGTDDR